ncbi:MAG TPA: aminoglycoside phosphotransferase family protein [Acidimicrobiales bacterium]|nr:aminoglycoside phosphotransferase family protein [Acidimicrobiales bacterium]
MTHMRMHPDELDLDDEVVRRLLREQHPQWADLPIERVVSSGTDNAMFRLGDSMVARLPRVERAVPRLETELAWLPALAPHLPIATPQPLATGTPNDVFPWTWAVLSWIDGVNAFDAAIPDLSQAVHDVAAVMRALWQIDPSDGPRAREGRRGTPLATTEAQTRRAIEQSQGLVDTRMVLSAWEEALRAPEWNRDPVWFHGDIARGNLLVRDGRIAALIDFGSIAVGDPACDLVIAWDLFDAETRPVLRAALDVDDATWDRGRGWALCTAMWALPYYLHTNPPMVRQARSKIAQVLADMR